MASLKSMLDFTFRFVCHSPIPSHCILNFFWIAEIPGSYTHWLRWVDLTQCLLIPWGGCSYLSRGQASILYLEFHLISCPSSFLLHYSNSINVASKRTIQANILWKNWISAFESFGSTKKFEFQFNHIQKYNLIYIYQILGQACDNASNNDTMLASLEELNPNSASRVHTCIHCICHILNLVVKVGLDTML